MPATMHSLFGPYWLLRRIGLGDLAEVFVATRSEEGDEYVTSKQPSPSMIERQSGMELCAIKRISREMSSYDEVLELFSREGQLAARLAHPKVVAFFEQGRVGERPYIAMEYIPGANLARLRDRIAPRRFPPGPALRVILDICEALEYVHDVTDENDQPLAIVHGDLTPTNILVSTSGVAKVIDFSVASSGLEDREHNTVRGTYAYMSPEQVRGQAIDRRTDIFALGVVLWELLTGKRLFRRNANYLTLRAVVEEPAPALSSMSELGFGDEVAALDRVLARTLAKERDARYSHMAELATELLPLAKELDWDIRPWTLKALVRELLS